MRALVDTNILLRSAQPNHPLSPQATNAVSGLLRRGDSVFFCAQNIAEFWNVATRPAGANGLGMTNQEVLKEIGAIEAALVLDHHSGATVTSRRANKADAASQKTTVWITAAMAIHHKPLPGGRKLKLNTTFKVAATGEK